MDIWWLYREYSIIITAITIITVVVIAIIFGDTVVKWDP